MNILLDKIQKKYKNFSLELPRLEIQSPSIVGLVGNNGAGKTTLLKCILDLVKLDKGAIYIGGLKNDQTDKWLLKTGSFLDNSFLFEFLKPLEYFELIRKNFNISKEDFFKLMNMFKVFLNSVDEKKIIRELSSGNKHKIGIVSAFINFPDLLILDEPFNFLDPSSQHELVRVIKKYEQSKICTMIISSHNILLINEIASSLLLIEDGKLKFDLLNTVQNQVIMNNYFKR